ncbi:MAG: class I SAM-dependent methyltransferase [Myxococcales bacterium]|nr:class I SAM-dependent methyltransferase [Myxococcales bacterium]MCB9700589.1 class I SAM-dependent methyltransferase [Myxococcales bacterium]
MSVRIELRREHSRHGPAEGPWIRRRWIARTLGPPDPASLACVVDHRGEVRGWGLYGPESELTVRLLTFGSEAPPEGWLEARLAAALRARAALGLERQGTSGVREVNSEGDGLPGLVIDRYGPVRVLQITTAAMAARQGAIVAWLKEHAPGDIFVIHPQSAAEREGFVPEPVIAAGIERLAFAEHGIDFEVPAPPSQKTGAYFDQRENRRRIAELAAGHGGPLLDLGTHVGGFAIHAAAAGVTAVGVDQSAPALALAAANAARNGVAERCAWVRADLFGELDDPQLAGPFGTIVVDPPKIASSPRDLGRALKALRACLARVIPRLADDGFLVICSCSHHLGREHLDQALTGASSALWTRLLALGPGADHPVLPGHVEGEYLRVNVYQRRA